MSTPARLGTAEGLAVPRASCQLQCIRFARSALRRVVETLTLAREAFRPARNASTFLRKPGSRSSTRVLLGYFAWLACHQAAPLRLDAPFVAPWPEACGAVARPADIGTNKANTMRNVFFILLSAIGSFR